MVGIECVKNVIGQIFSIAASSSQARVEHVELPFVHTLSVVRRRAEVRVPLPNFIVALSARLH